MKILFSPSEAKSKISTIEAINSTSLIFENLFCKREEIIDKYLSYIETTPYEELKSFFGTKKDDECNRYKKIDILNNKTQKAIQRYNGVAYEYLKYDLLDNSSKKYIDENVVIFSNLFGPILAKDTIPYYRFKQGATLQGFKVENFYKEYFSSSLDEFLKNELIIDLRAGFYEKFYTLKQPYITMKFKKNGKVVSHWAKAYRGIILKELAKYQPQTKEEFEKIEFQNLKIIEILTTKLKSEYIFEIFE